MRYFNNSAKAKLEKSKADDEATPNSAEKRAEIEKSGAGSRLAGNSSLSLESMHKRRKLMRHSTHINADEVNLRSSALGLAGIPSKGLPGMPQMIHQKSMPVRKK